MGNSATSRFSCLVRRLAASPEAVCGPESDGMGWDTRAGRHGGAPPEAHASVSLFALYPNWCSRTGEPEKKQRFRFLARIKTVVRAPVPRASIPARGKGGAWRAPPPHARDSRGAWRKKPPVIHAGIDARAHRGRFWRMHTDRPDMHRGPWPMQKRGGMHEKHVDYHAGRPCGWPKRGRLASITLTS